MYLVELRPGNEELYRSSDELALAIRNGDVDARSRVYHRATAKWISITLHPQYKAIVAASKGEPAPRPARRVWGLLGGSSDQTIEAPEASAADGAPLLQRWRRPLALGISSLLLVSGIQLAFSGPRPPWAGRSQVAATSAKKMGRTGERTRTAVQRATMATPPALVSLASSKAAWPEETASADTLAKADSVKRTAPILPRAPRLRSKSLRDALAPEARETTGSNSLEALVARYTAAHDSAHSRLEAGMRVARLSRLFTPSRLSPGGGVTDTRMSLAGAGNFIRVYRQQQALIERAYQDTVTAMARQHGWSPRKVRAWYSRAPLKEAASLELLSGALLSSVDSVLGVLNAQAGAYKIRGTAIAFEDPSAGQAYGALRRRIKEQIDAAVTAGGATSRGPAGLLLQAIGTTSLPRET
jgi:hypothetical protein